MILAICRHWSILPRTFDELGREEQAELVADWRLECEQRARQQRLDQMRG